ncbi:MAG TPA: hypothetical protein VMU51_11125 [Mycobacteriales bacterium]|nr:hypothetical protein [Mycobacteriales bacterium]
MAVVDLDRIAAMLNGRGVRAVVEMTGGGIATVFGGLDVRDADGDTRYTFLVGPGWFDGPGWTLARADTADLGWGPDDSGDDPGAYTAAGPQMTEADIVAAIVARYPPSVPPDGEHVNP